MAVSLCKFRYVNSAVFRNLVRPLTTKPSQTSKHVLDEMFSDVERDRILECFNRCTPEELQFTKQLSHQKALAVVKYRERNGDFGSLSEILRVPGVGILGLQKLCTTMKALDYAAVQKLREKLDMETVKPSPPLSENLQQNLSSLVAVELHTDCVTFAQMSRGLTLEAWDMIPLFEKPFQRVDHVQFLDKLLQVVERLPKSEVYVFEGKIYRYTNLRVVPYLTNLRILEAMLVTLLNTDLSTSRQHRAYFLKPNSVMRFFKLSVGGERVSGQHIVRELQRGGGADVGDSLVGDVEVGGPMWDQFLGEKSLGQERLTNCLLLAVAFYKLVVHRTHSLQF
ncbi:transcription elongation factor, mitochondrial-like [Babylonia areolata]|uniref:transcription elongation factor, mitochondrial-like n=1 Tax=Babylonia areolata TaxID=304850 RepID=UPI003FD5A842